jgi:hypothetical protein
MNPMTNQFPDATKMVPLPPPKLVQQWYRDSEHQLAPYYVYIAARAAQWGADQELEACCAWFQEFYKTESWVKHDLKHFRTTRRPKPPSLKDQALDALNQADEELNESEWQQRSDTIRRALEQLND